MSISEKIEIVNNKIDQNKAQYSLDSQTAKTLLHHQENVGKYEFFIGKDALPKKD